MKTHQIKEHGFTLIELLAVVAILAIILSLSGGMSQGILESSQLQQGAETFNSQLLLARQNAMTYNKETEVRIYRTKGESGEEAWNAFSIGVADFESDQVNSDPNEVPFRQLTNRTQLPVGYSFIESSDYSSLLSGTGDDGEIREGTEVLPSESLRYRAFSFLPDGRLKLDSRKQWTLTIANSSSGNNTELPSNYFTFLIQPETGRARIYRP